jgi:hypothetical protein
VGFVLSFPHLIELLLVPREIQHDNKPGQIGNQFDGNASNLIVALMNFIFASRMACVSGGGSMPLLIAVFEGGLFPGRTFPTRSKGILAVYVLIPICAQLHYA